MPLRPEHTGTISSAPCSIGTRCRQQGCVQCRASFKESRPPWGFDGGFKVGWGWHTRSADRRVVSAALKWLRRMADSGAAPQSRSSQQIACAHARPDRVATKDFAARQPSLARSRRVPQKIRDFAHRIFFVVVVISNVQLLLPTLLFTVWTPYLCTVQCLRYPPRLCESCSRTRIKISSV